MTDRAKRLRDLVIGGAAEIAIGLLDALGVRRLTWAWAGDWTNRPRPEGVGLGRPLEGAVHVGKAPPGPTPGAVGVTLPVRPLQRS